MAAAIPFALKAGSMIGGALLGKKLSGPSKPQQAAMTGAQQGAQALTAAGQPLLTQGMTMADRAGGDLDAAGQYYRNILSSRTAGREALAPEMASALNFYRGAENKTRRTLRGGSRDVALAELDREKVGRMAMLLPEARRSAAQGILDVGGTRLSGGTALTGQGTNALANAAYAQGGLFNQATQLRGQEQEGGRAWGGILYDVLGALPWGKGGGGTLPSTINPSTLYGAASKLPAVTASNPYYR